MGVEKVIKFRYHELKDSITQLWMDLMLLSPHLTQEERDAVLEALAQCEKAVKGEPQS